MSSLSGVAGSSLYLKTKEKSQFQIRIRSRMIRLKRIHQSKVVL